jgi:Protein of unknown function (DUF3500)
MVDRRHFLFGAAAAATLPFAPLAALAQSAADLGPATAFRERVTALLTALQPDQRQRALFPFGGDVQRNWNFMGIGGFIKPGIRLEEMDAAQKERAWDVLSSIMSPRGIEKTRDVMTLQQVLIEQGNGAATRGRERFSFAVFGEPAAQGQWALRYEGHHLSLTFNVANDRLVGVTPSSFSVNPNRVENGNYAGLVTLKREDNLARKLAADFSGATKERAFFMERPFRNIRALAGREMPFEKREGVAIGDLGSAQRDLLIELVDAFATEHLQPQHASGVAQRIQSGDAAAVHFGFAGSTTPGEPAYYRIHGDHILIEFASVDDAAQHLHTIFHLS